MKKLFLSLALIAGSLMVCSCADDLEAHEEMKTRNQENTIILSEAQKKSLDWLYFNCATQYAQEISAVGLVFINPTIDEEVQVVRFCDYFCDETGKYVCEFPEYDDVKEILWPDGFGEFKNFQIFPLNESDFS